MLETKQKHWLVGGRVGVLMSRSYYSEAGKESECVCVFDGKVIKKPLIPTP